MDCLDVADLLLTDEREDDPLVDQHVADCPSCAHIAQGLHRLDRVLTATLLIAPPFELQQRLAQIALDAAKPQTPPWWRQLSQVNLTQWFAQRPQMIAAQGLATVMLALASWQIFGWVSTFQPVVGDVGYAMELVAASPAVAYLGSFQIDFQSLGIWSVVGMIGWAVSENGPVGRRIAASGLKLP